MAQKLLLKMLLIKIILKQKTTTNPITRKNPVLGTFGDSEVVSKTVKDKYLRFSNTFTLNAFSR